MAAAIGISAPAVRRRLHCGDRERKVAVASMKIAALEEGKIRLPGLHAGFTRGEKIAVAQTPQLRAEIKKMLRDNMDHEARTLQPPAHRKKVRGHHRAAIFCKNFWPDDDIGGAGLVFECHE